MSHTQSTWSRVVVAVGASALSACQAFEPTVKSLQDPPREPRDKLRPTLSLPPPTRIADEPEFARRNVRVAAHLPTRSNAEPTHLELRGKPLAEAIHTICAAAGVNVYLDAALDTKVDATFVDVSLDTALQTILARNELMLVEDPPGIYWVTRDDANQPDERRFKLKSARAAEIEPKLKALLPTGAQLVVDAEQNFVMVRGRRSDVDIVAQYIEAADRIQEQVLIEMRIVEITLGEQFELGVSHNFNGIDVGDDSLTILQQFATTSDDFSLNFRSANGVVDSTLQALGRYVGVELLSSPRVVAVNNTQASIDITREVPYIQSTTNVTSGTTGGVGSSSTQEVAFKPVGVKMQVTPSIRANGVIEFSVTQDLSEVAEFLNGVPAVDRRTLTSRFQVRDGETLVVGGLMQDKKSKTDRGIPLLMDLPVLGALFKSKEDRVDKREMLVFISPRIIALDAAGGVTDSWRQVFDSRRRELGLDESVANERRAAGEAKR
ncbi:MAG: hypothetical protein SGI72_00240 [Planctomycetota bacterium]|nr:hypothetical protein [Planctomycetota bacterium]